jgi:hypothetical protein
MILIPKTLYAQYLNFLKKNNVVAEQYQEYVKWLRYFLDFCAKHVITPDKSERIRLFTEKLSTPFSSSRIRFSTGAVGHTSLKTTMIPVRTVKEQRSPLDF